MEYEKDAEKLKNVLNALNTSAYNFSIKLGYKSHSSIYYVRDGIKALSSAMIQRITTVYPQVSYNYLVSDELPILLDEVGMQAQANALNVPLPKSNETFQIERVLQTPQRLDSIEEDLADIKGKLDEVLKKLK